MIKNGKDWYYMFFHRALKEGLRAVNRVNEIVLGFNINVDYIKHVDQALLNLLYKYGENINLQREYTQKTINSIDDLLYGLLRCMRDGIGEEWKIVDESVYDWINKNIREDERRIGGQVGIMANMASVLGAKKTIINAPLVPEIMVNLLKDRIYVPRKKNNKITLVSPKDIATKEKKLIHWIFEFKKDFKVSLPNLSFCVPNGTRFIATYDPINAEIIIDSDFREYIRENSNRIEGAILSGHHLLESGKTKTYYRSKIMETIEIIRLLRQNPKTVIKYEFAMFSDLNLSKMLMATILPEVDIISLNELELYQILNKDPNLNIPISRSEKIIDSLMELYHTAKPKFGIHLHTFDFTAFIINTKRLTEKNIENILISMAFGSYITSIRAHLGREPTPKEIESWDSRQFIIKDTSIKLIEIIKQQFDIEYVNNYCVFNIDSNKKLVVLPVLFVEYPKRTVGLGDTCSIGQFLTYLGLCNII